MNFTDFQAKWGAGGTAASLNERQGAQPHFMDLCALLGVPAPGSSRQDGQSDYIFEQDTASQQTRRLASGAVVPVLSVRPEPVEGSLKASTGSARTGGDVVRTVEEAIAEAAHKLTTLRDNWLNPPDWTQSLPEIVPLGMSTSPYPDRIVHKPGHEKELSERTLTKLYNARPAWLDTAHKTLDAAVATAYGWTDYTPEMPDEVILQRLLALNVERSVARSATTPSLRATPSH